MSTYSKACFFLIVLLLFSCGLRDHSENQESSKVKYRPQIHFSPQENWMNGPAGLVYLEDEYHLFYPYNPQGNMGRATHWGHAVSPDLIHWDELPIALVPDSLGAIISGCVVVDVKNTSGLGSIDNPPLVAIFTYHNYDTEIRGNINIESQGLAYSLDKGRTWMKYQHNPIIPNPGIRGFKDPKVVWNDSNRQWVMVLAVDYRLRFYTSTNLIEWNCVSNLGKDLGNEEDIWECPDLFEMQVDDSGEKQWILMVSMGLGRTGEWGTGYFTGDFDGITFSTVQTDPLWIDYGNDNYAGTTFSNMPDSRRILIGWMNNWEYAAEIPTSTWNGTTTIPRELSLTRTNGNYMLTSQPVKEMGKLTVQSVEVANIDIVQDINRAGILDMTPQVSFPLLPSEVNIRFSLEDMDRIGFAEKFGISLKNEHNESILIGYDNFNRLFYVDRRNAVGKQFSENFKGMHILPFDVKESETLDMRIIFDTSSFELFAMGGKVVMTDVFFPTSDFSQIELFSENGKVTVDTISITQLRSIR